MGERAECPVCKSYSSTVLYDINNGDPCRSCSCPLDVLIRWQQTIEDVENLRRKRVDDLLVKRLEELEGNVAFYEGQNRAMVDLFSVFEYEIEETLKKLSEGLSKAIREKQ